jgi:uncharacterized MnhB-related membrane protein
VPALQAQKCTDLLVARLKHAPICALIIADLLYVVVALALMIAALKVSYRDEFCPIALTSASSLIKALSHMVMQDTVKVNPTLVDTLLDHELYAITILTNEQ